MVCFEHRLVHHRFGPDHDRRCGGSLAALFVHFDDRFVNDFRDIQIFVTGNAGKVGRRQFKRITIPMSDSSSLSSYWVS